MSQKPKTSWRYQFISAALAFVCWGGWALFINSQSKQSGATSPIVSGLIQGIGSSMLTLIMVQLVTWMYAKFAEVPFRLILPAICITLVTGTCMTLIHLYAGTADVIGTVAPAIVVAFCFNTFTATKLREDSLNKAV